MRQGAHINTRVANMGAEKADARRRRSDARWMLAVLGCLAVLTTAFSLMLPAITMTRGDLVCNLEEHTHSAACYEKVLVCGQDEAPADEDGEGGHEHTASCYEKVLTCGKKPHKHGDACYERVKVEEPSSKGDSGAGAGADVDGGVAGGRDAGDSAAGGQDAGAAADDSWGARDADEGAGGDAYPDDGGAGNDDVANGEPESAPVADVDSQAGDYANPAAADEPAPDSGQSSARAPTGTTIGKDVLASDGANYRITVTCGSDAGIPEGADLAVEEITEGFSAHGMSYEDYVASAETALDMEEGSAGYIRLFDIMIVDADGQKVQPADGTTVGVTIELADADNASLDVVHFEDGANEGVVVEAATESAAEGQAVTFEAEGFSVYGVVARGSVPATDLDGKSYVLVTNNGGNSALLMGEDHPEYPGRLASIRVNPSPGSTIQLNEPYTQWTFEAVPGQPGWYYISDGSGHYLNIISEPGDGGSVVLDGPQAIYVASQGSGNSVTYQLRTAEVQAGSKAVNNYNKNPDRGFGAWVAGNDGNEWFRLLDVEYLGENDPSDYKRITFNQNGGSTVPDPGYAWGLPGNTITLPDYAGTREGYTFVGWSTRNNVDRTDTLTPVYPAGSEYTIPDSATTLYAVWNDNTVSQAKFTLRLDGTIPHEPGTFPSSAYSGGTTITGTVTLHRWIIDVDISKPSNGLYVINDVFTSLNQTPTIGQIVADLNGSSSKTGFSVENRDGDVVVSEITNATTNANNVNVSVGDALLIMWYVQKRQNDGYHIDGAILIKNRVSIAYEGNTPDATHRNVPRGYQEDPGTTITVGADGGKNGTVRTPTRTGYIFLGWNTKSDGSGTWYQNNDSYVLNEDTTLYAQWSKGTDTLTVTKVNEYNEAVAGATFKLEERTAGGAYIEKATRETNANGLFSYEGLENDTLYRLTETAAPYGYETQDAFFFKVAADEDDPTSLQVYVCDQDGNHITAPSWLEKSYTPASAGQGVARVQFRITDDLTKRNVTFVKVDEEGNPLPGAEYTLVNANDRDFLAALKPSGADGVFSVVDAALPYGTYTLTETKPPVKYAAHAPVQFTLGNYEDAANHGLTITDDPSTCVVEASCEVSSSPGQGTTYAYTVKVKDVQQPHIIVTKAVAVDGDLDPSDLDTTIYFALTKKGEGGYVTKGDEIWIESIQVVNGVPTPAQVVFDGVDYGEYDVWEMALIGDEYTRMYNGLVVGANFQLDTVSARSADGGNNANVSAADLEAQVDFTNHYGKVTQSTRFVANKRWTARDGETAVEPPAHAVVEFTLYSEKKDASGQIIDGTEEEVRSIELDGVHDPDGEDTPWVATFKYLPVYYDGTLEYSYKVKETVTVDGFYPNDYPQEYYVTTSGGTITNRQLLTDVELHKHFEIYPEDASLLDSVEGLTFTLTGPGGMERSFDLSDFEALTGADSTGHDYVLTVPDLPLGEYTFTETGQENQFTDTEYSLVHSVSQVTAESEIGGAVQPVLKLELENSYAKSGTLVVKKESIIHEAVDEDEVPAEISGKAFTFVVKRGNLYLQADGTLGASPFEFSLSEGGFREFPTVPAGNYTVIEKNAAVEGYNWDVVDGVRNAEDGSYSKSLTISDEDPAGEAAFDNRYTKIENGSLTVSKTVDGGPEQAANKDYRVTIKTKLHGDDVWLDADGNFTSTKTVLTVSKDSSLVFPQVPAGTYVVEENVEDAAFADYSLDVTYADDEPAGSGGEPAGSDDEPAGSGDEPAGSGNDPAGLDGEPTDSQDDPVNLTDGSVTLHKDGQVSVAITNSYTYLYTPVKITKTVTGNMGDKTLFFGFDLYVTEADGVPIVIDGVTDAAGKIQFNLRDGQYTLLNRLPKGAVLRIVEHNEHYVTTVDGRIGVGDGETTNPLDAEEQHDDVSQDTTETYTFTIPDKGATVDFFNDHTEEQSVVLKKVGHDNRDDRIWDLAGATFRIYEDQRKTKPVTLDGKTEFTSDEDGLLYVGKLGVGTYYLDETTVPDGYNAPPSMFKLTIGKNAVSLAYTTTSGQPSLNDWITEEVNADTGEKTYTIAIRNTTGYELPSTGGPGTAPLHLLGVVLICLAGAALALKRRYAL